MSGAFLLRSPYQAFPDAPESLQPLIESAHATLRQAIVEHGPVAAISGFSGGKDSLATTLLVTRLLTPVKVAHINTGIGIEQTREFVRTVAARHRWDFIELHPPDKTYRDIITRWGFPGPSAHRFAYIWLKERALFRLVRDLKVGHKRTARVLILTGVRSEESRRRMGHVESIYRQGGKVWVAPIHGWNGLQVREFIAYCNETLNPVSDILGYSGECLCGAYAKPGERDLLRTFFPDAEAKLVELEALAKAHDKPCVWGGRSKKGDAAPKPRTAFMPMCVGCEGNEHGHGESNNEAPTEPENPENIAPGDCVYIRQPLSVAGEIWAQAGDVGKVMFINAAGFTVRLDDGRWMPALPWLMLEKVRA